MTDTYTIKDATKDVQFLLTLTNLFESDEKGFWYDKGLKERHLLKMEPGEDGKEIVIFQDPLPKGDHYLFNPFSEGFGKKSPAVQLFYRTIRITFNLNLTTALRYMVREVLNHKEALVEDPDHKLNHTVSRMSSVYVDKKTTLSDVIDEKMVDEFDTLIDRVKDEFVHIPYLHQQMTAKVMCDALTDTKWDEKYGKDIRKKSLTAFKSALMGVLGIKDPSDLNDFSVKYDPDLKTSAKLYTTLSVYLKLYTRFNDVLGEAFASEGMSSSENEIDLGTLQTVLDRSHLAYAIAKHMIQPVMPKTSITDTSTVDTSRLNVGGGNKLTLGTKRFPGPEVVDEFGRRGLARNQPLQLGQQPTSRFRPHILNDQPADPFAPAVRPIGNSGFGGFGSVGSFGQSSGPSYFNEPQSGGLNLNPPNNFGSPINRRNYF